MKDKQIGILLLIIVIILLGVTLFVNVSGVLNFLQDPLVGEGFGILCDTKEDCVNFCQNNMGRCRNYCQENPENKLCNEVLR